MTRQRSFRVVPPASLQSYLEEAPALALHCFSKRRARLAAECFAHAQHHLRPLQYLPRMYPMQVLRCHTRRDVQDAWRSLM